MNFKKRLPAVLVIVFVVVAIIVAVQFKLIGQDPNVPVLGKETVRFWYTDDTMTDYLSSAAVAFSEAHDDVRVVPTLVSGTEFLEAINTASLGEEVPDVYLASNDILEKAYLAGLAAEIPEDSICNTENFSQTALDAVTYKNKLIAYPMYYQTSAFLYNKTYLDAMEDNQVPTTIAAIETYADEHDAPEGLESFFTWDVTDIFYNYFFVGNYLNVGGDPGDDAQNIDIYNLDTIKCLRVYQELNQFFSIEADEVSYDRVIQDFMDGKLMFTVATTDVVNTLETAKAEGRFNYDYGITMLPDVTDELKVRSMSVTEGVVINGYSEHKDAAAEFAAFLVQDSADTLYARTGKVSAYLKAPYDYPALAEFAKEYQRSVPIPKMIETGNLWVQLEIAFIKIWEGTDANQELKTLSEQIMTQVTGSEYTEEVIEEPVEETQAPDEIIEESVEAQG
ncbi:MAG: extracellular solute-binding protein [Lachnospiraceae bacterium]|nr:extracellular solute-binding protein [Lachnospiraceae bacterium]